VAQAAAAQPCATFSIFRRIVSGTPAATPLAPAALDRISLRTMPDRTSALATPLALRLVPSPGYGPPVSSGITEQTALPLPVLAAPVVVVELDRPKPSSALTPPPHPASGKTALPAPANSQRSDWRRVADRASMRARSAPRLRWCSTSWSASWSAS
jgi:hypothetical protein